jgi:FXSXX-COOH protein
MVMISPSETAPESSPASGRESSTALTSPLPDVTGIALGELLVHDDSVLQNALARLLSESDSHDVVAGFNAAI